MKKIKKVYAVEFCDTFGEGKSTMTIATSKEKAYDYVQEVFDVDKDTVIIIEDETWEYMRTVKYKIEGDDSHIRTIKIYEIAYGQILGDIYED